jgi:hypothetical protein
MSAYEGLLLAALAVGWIAATVFRSRALLARWEAEDGARGGCGAKPRRPR